MHDFAEKTIDGFLTQSGDVISEKTLANGAIALADYNWMLIAFGITLAGGAYPVLLYMLAVVFFLFQWLFVGGSQLIESVDDFNSVMANFKCNRIEN